MSFFNDNWYQPYEPKDSLVFYNDPIIFEDIVNGMKNFAEIEMIVTDHVTQRGANHVNVVFHPKFDFKLKRMTYEEWYKTNYFGIRRNPSIMSDDTKCPSVFEHVKQNVLSTDRIILSLHGSRNVFRWDNKKFFDWAISIVEKTSSICQEIKNFLALKDENYDTWHSRFEEAYKKLSNQTIRFVYQRGLEFAFSKLAREKVIVILTDCEHTPFDFKSKSLEDIKSYYIHDQVWGMFDAWKLKYKMEKAMEKSLVIHVQNSFKRGYYAHFKCSGCSECAISGTVKCIREYVSYGKMICKEICGCKSNVIGSEVRDAIFNDKLQDENVEDATFLFGKGWLLKFNDIHVHIIREISFEIP